MLVAACLPLKNAFRSQAAAELDCPVDEVVVEATGNLTRAAGCGGIVDFRRVCHTQVRYETITTPSRYEHGKSRQVCNSVTVPNWGGKGTRSEYRCRTVFDSGRMVPGTTRTEQKRTEVCSWVKDEIHYSPRPGDPQTRWDVTSGRARPGTGATKSSRAPERPAHPTATDSPSGTSGTTHSTAPPTPSELETRVVIEGLDDVFAAEVTFRSWIGQPVRVLLGDQRVVEGVIRYVRNHRLTMDDGTEIDFEQIAVADRITFGPMPEGTEGLDPSMPD
jgi:hypothetical protein